MTLKLYNTLTRQKEEFLPLTPPQVKMYVCGITPYDETHLGHARAYITFDVIRRYLEVSGYEVFYIQNITDIDDKIIQKAKLKSQKYHEVAEEYTASYFAVMDQLNVKRADAYPKATEHIPEMINWIESLIENGNAYVVEGDVYFSVDKFYDYGKLSKRESKDMQAGARIAIDERKKNALDFALWKKAKEGEPSWESPWGRGRPGWHIECSVMSSKYLGEQFDIHGGGLDLIFPHHENEIAQTEAKTGKVPWVKYWIHNGFVTINQQKMSKSLGNFFTLKDIFKTYEPMVVRFFLLLTHYRSPVNYSDQELNNAKEAYSRIVKFVKDIDFRLKKSSESAPIVELEDLEEDILGYKNRFRAAMEDDFNTAGAMAAIFEMIHFFNKAIQRGEVERECLEEMKQSVLELCEILGLKINVLVEPEPASATSSSQIGRVIIKEEEIEELITEREKARKMKDFSRADQIRNQLKEKGIILEDTAYGTKWSRL
jgi:cysteinyl-tRNA synthetase